MLFWTLLLSDLQRRSPRSRIAAAIQAIAPYALAVLAGVAIFFLAMLNFVTRPFDLLATVPRRRLRT